MLRKFFLFLFIFFNLNCDSFKIDPPLSALFNYFKIQHNGILKYIVTKIQPWKRKPELERWQVQEIEVKDKNYVISLLKKLNFVDSIYPKKQEYDYAILLGADTKNVIARINFLIDLWKNGIRFKNLICLGAQRPCDKNDIIPEWQNLKVQPKTETEIIKFYLNTFHFPDSLNIVFVDTPMVVTKEMIKRPNTQDTVLEWLKCNPKPGSCLVISNNPYIKYQDAILKKNLPKDFEVETVGPASFEGVKISIYLDTICRWLYALLNEEFIMDNVIVGAEYVHYKGNHYKVIALAHDSEDPKKIFVIYQGLYDCPEFGKNPTWVRPIESFSEMVKVNEKEVPRFKKN
jgi:hypothetical protein